MTTTVTVLISGNKACRVWLEGATSDPPKTVLTVLPGGHASAMIHGDLVLAVREEGDFLPEGKLAWVRPEVIP